MSLTPMVNVDPVELTGDQVQDVVMTNGAGDQDVVMTHGGAVPVFTIRVLEELQSNVPPVSRHHDRSNNVVVTPQHHDNTVTSLKKNNLYTSEKLSLECEWADCVDYYDHYGQFSAHVSGHIHEAEVRDVEHVEPPLDKVFGCLWTDCGFESPDSEEMVRHINFHAFHTKIKCHGRNMLVSTVF